MEYSSGLLAEEFSTAMLLIDVSMTIKEVAGITTATIIGDPSAEQVAFVANSLCSKTIASFDIEPQWLSGNLGILQLVVLSAIGNKVDNLLLKN